MLEALAALAKLLLYAGALAGAGTAFAAASLGSRLGSASSLARSIIRAGATSAILGALGHVYFLILRLGGDFSAPVLSAILESPTGAALALQLTGSLVLIAFASARRIRNYACVIGGILTIVSFGINGHAGSLNLTSGAIAALHVGAAAQWSPMLASYIDTVLWPACGLLAAGDFTGLIRRFSGQAMMVVVGLVAAGVALILTLVNFSHPDWFTPYVQLLSLKVALAASVLALAAFNKLRLTPRLRDEDGRAIRGLRLSIMFEIAIISAVLATTALLTTYTSPHT